MVANGVPVRFNVPVAGASFGSPFVLNNIDKTRIAVAGSAIYVTQDTLTGANYPKATSVVLSLTELGNTNSEITAIDYGTATTPMRGLLAAARRVTQQASYSSARARLRVRWSTCRPIQALPQRQSNSTCGPTSASSWPIAKTFSPLLAEGRASGH